MRMSSNHTLSPLLVKRPPEITPGAAFMPLVNGFVNVPGANDALATDCKPGEPKASEASRPTRA